MPSSEYVWGAIIILALLTLFFGWSWIKNVIKGRAKDKVS